MINSPCRMCQKGTKWAPSPNQKTQRKKKRQKLTSPNPPRPRPPSHHPPQLPITPHTPKQRRPQQPFIHMPRPETLPIQPASNPKPPALIRLDDRLHQRLLPLLFVSSHIQHHFGFRVCSYKLRSKHGSRGIRHRLAVTQKLVEV